MAPAEKENKTAGATIEEIFGSNEGVLLGYAWKLVQSREVAEDLVQEAFMRLSKSFQEVQQPKPWLFKTVHNLAMNHHRQNSKLTSLSSGSAEDQELEAVDAQPLPDEQLEKMEAIGQTLLCLEGLDERKKALIKMKFEEGLSYKEMATRTGMTTSHVGYSLHYTLKEMAVTLKKNGVLS